MKTIPLRWALPGWMMLILIALAMPCARGADENPPERMTYQGFLVDGNGIALGNSAPKNYDVIFRIYDAQGGGNLKWSEQQTVTVDKGYFSVLLGEGSTVGSEPHAAISTVFAGADASERYVGMTVKGIGTDGADADILPRLRMLTSPYAYLSKKAISATTATTAGTLENGANITSGTVADARLSSNVALLNANQTFSALKTFGTGAAVSGANVIEFGQGVAGKHVNAGKIGYESFTSGALDIVGAGPSNQKIKMWADGGVTMTGPLAVGGNITSPRFTVSQPLWATQGNWHGRSGTFVSGGGTLVITMSVTAYTGSPGIYYPALYFDGAFVGSTVLFLNQANVHHAFPVRTIVLTGQPAGTHTIRIEGNGAAVDSNDYSEVIVVEYPF